MKLSPYTKDISNQVFGKLTVLEYLGTDNKKAWWLLQCECGKMHKAVTGNLTSGRVKSCGCAAEMTQFKQKHKNTHTTVCEKTNKIQPTKTYKSWISMKSRCLYKGDKSYPRYGGRGIKICDRWVHSFDNFVEDMGERPDNTTLDRIDVNGDYTPTNCIWASIIEQNNNKRNNSYITYNNVTKTAAQWGREMNISPKVILRRINKLNWSIEDALQTPIRAKSKMDHLLTYNGITQNVTNWAKTLGISRAKLYARLSSGWSVEDTLTK